MVNFSFEMVRTAKIKQNTLSRAKGLTFELLSRVDPSKPRKPKKFLATGVTCGAMTC